METYEEQIFPGFEEESLCSARAYPASQPPWPGSEEAALMTAGSGRQLSMLFETSSRLGAFSKILLESSHWTSSEEFSYVWNRLDTKFALSAFQLMPLGLSTEDSGSSLWQTPRNEGFDAGKHNGKADSLHSQAKEPKLWPSPTAGDAKASGSRNTPESKAHGGLSLTDAARQDGGMGRLWPTPTSSEQNVASASAETRRRPNGICLADAAKLWPTPTVPNGGRRNPEGTSLTGQKPDGGKAQIDIREVAIRTLREAGLAIGSGSLNPRFVEELMGFPIDHTALKR